MDVKKRNILKKIDCLDLGLTLDCGQAFRWKERDGIWHGVIGKRAYDISADENGIVFYAVDDEEFDSVLSVYFDIERDYTSLTELFSEDGNLKTAVTAYPGIRILRQEPWEALCSFIISQNNNIPRIKGIIERLCESFGDDIGNGDYTFPSAEKLACLSEEDLAPLRAGFRAKYILDAARKVSSGEVNLQKLSEIPIEEARTELMKIKGVGPKVAECALLYGCGRTEAFPVDVWVKRIMSELYPEGLPECTNGVQGIAQQYLFHWRRNLNTSDNDN